MDITENQELFWLTLERDQTIIPLHIKNAFSFVGFANALSFKSIVKENIDSTEQFIRTELLHQVENEPDNANLKTCLFGRFFANPSVFKFDEGDIKLIEALVTYVKRIVDDPEECEHTDYFHKANLKKLRKKSVHQLIETPIGTLFGTKSIANNVHHANVDANLKQMLYDKAQAEFLKYQSDEFQMKQQFTIDSVTVNKIYGDTATGTVICTYCDVDSNETVNLFCKSVKTAIWVSSNIKKHMMNHHKSVFEAKPNDNNARAKRKRKSQILSTNIVAQMNALSLEETISKQIRDQIHLIRSVNNYGKPSSDKQNVQTLRPPNENTSLFEVLSHQLEPKLLSDEDRENKVKELRMKVVDYIKQNFDYFAADVQDHIRTKHKNYKGSSVSNRKCADFLKHLGTNGMAGPETIRAVNLMYKVNIIVINESGLALNPCRFNTGYSRSLIIYQKEGKNASVTSLSEDIVLLFTTKLSETISDEH